MRAFSRTVIFMVLLAIAAFHNAEARPVTRGENSGKTIDEMITDASKLADSYNYRRRPPFARLAVVDNGGSSLSSNLRSSQPLETITEGKDTFVKVELDILVKLDEYKRDERYRKLARQTRGFIRGARNKRWPNNTVLYSIESSHYNSKQVGVIQDSIDEWSKLTCMKFVINTTAKNRVLVKNGNRGCASAVGMIRGTQFIFLSSGCIHKAVIMHEIGHTLGLKHEHQRPDRDAYIRVLEDNINAKWRSAFAKAHVFYTTMRTPYDLLSLMHYGKSVFANRGTISIETKDPAYQDLIGRAPGPSFGDIKIVNLNYNCKRHTSGCTMTDNECPGEGFVGKDCTCLCPGDSRATPIKPCPEPTTTTTTTTTTAQPPSEVCEDRDGRICIFYKVNGVCIGDNWFEAVVRRNCAKTCGVC